LLKNKILLRKIYKYLLITALIFTVSSCGKKEEPQTFVPPQQETSIDKEKENREREEFERLRRLQNGETDSLTSKTDSAALKSDTSKVIQDTSKKSSSLNTDKKKFVQKEKELNKRLDNPRTAISDYMEFLQRGTGEGGNFEANMKKASDLWESGNINRFKTAYKNTKKIVILEEPKVISQKGNEAVVEVKIKKTDKVNNKSEDLEMTVRYNLIADSKGKWKIRDNSVIKK
jgi:hypothetical protein